MGGIEDSRKAVQDFIAPDLKALAVKLELLEKKIETQFEHADKKNLERFAAVEKLASVRYETLLATIATNHANVMNTLEM